ncbi:nucleotide exchange factor GrpE [Polycyclovorans algicola]|uniref:nucleotide exchange factor GrpE n=1 Tax=Polycyclovorans algicola TaxID=616992 RepID=UPI0004A6B80A|nr:nucleotide exchange factor GrpE [Polycyclovorans algicola]
MTSTKPPSASPDADPDVGPHAAEDAGVTTEAEIPLEAQLVALESALAEAEQAAAQAKDAQLRAAADFENTRRRLERDAQRTAQYATENLLKELLAVADSVELGLKAALKPDAEVAKLTEGMELTQRQVTSFLEKQGVTAVDPAGQPFNPDEQQAMSMIESVDVAPNHVLAVMQKGYRLHDRLLRPAMVIVAKAPPEADKN